MKRSPELQELSRDHHQALVLAKVCARAGDIVEEEKIGAMCSEVRRSFEKSLASHFKFEEEHLLPLLREAREFVLVAQVLKEHEELRKMVRNISLHGDAPTLVAFGQLMSAHIRFEEREMFPRYEALSDKCGSGHP